MEVIYIPELTEGWDGDGHCQARHILEQGDWCNKPVIEGGLYCTECTCIVPGCKEKWGTMFPLLPGEPRFCREHYKTDRFEYGCQ